MLTDQEVLLRERDSHKELAQHLGGELYGWGSAMSCTIRINGALYEISGPIYKALADARLRIRELEGEVVGWKSAVETVEAQRDDARLRIRELEEALRETAAKLAVCERDYESMCETASREIERKNKAIEAAELLRRPGGLENLTADRLLAEAKGETT